MNNGKSSDIFKRPHWTQLPRPFHEVNQLSLLLSCLAAHAQPSASQAQSSASHVQPSSSLEQSAHASDQGEGQDQDQGHDTAIATAADDDAGHQINNEDENSNDIIATTSAAPAANPSSSLPPVDISHPTVSANAAAMRDAAEPMIGEHEPPTVIICQGCTTVLRQPVCGSVD
ncbi:hypothetical protein GGR56DRAFT_54923 [Xylariaceae sp. FL0804]|nr:hypothetical protein GGR56DRAFT_54923 [Xylariaceae sp. FL0804]